MVRVGSRTWVVYQIGPIGPQAGALAVCTQAEWDALERAVPGRHSLVRGLLPTEAMAERLARDLRPPTEAPSPHRRKSLEAILRERAAR